MDLGRRMVQGSDIKIGLRTYGGGMVRGLRPPLELLTLRWSEAGTYKLQKQNPKLDLTIIN